MIAVGGVFVLLYGLVLSGAVIAWKNIPDPEPPVRKAPELAYVPIGPLPIADSSRTTGDSKKEGAGKDKASAGDSKKGGSKEKDKSSKNKPKNKNSKKTDDKKKVKDKDNAKDKEKADANASKEGDAKKPNEKSDSPSPTEVAFNTVAPVPAPAPPTLTPQATGPKADHWGLLSGFAEDCKFQTDGEGLTVNVPGSLHILSPDLKRKNAPRLLVEAGGDFIAQVSVVGKISPGNVPLTLTGEPSQQPQPQGKDKTKKQKEKKPKVVPTFPLTFQGAGLLVWADADNYIRLERTSTYFLEDGKKVHQVLFELCRDGKLVSDEKRDVKEANLALRIERKGTELRCSYSPDEGKTWLDVKRLQKVALPPVVQVGVSAANVSSKAFAARFENFELTAKPSH